MQQFTLEYRVSGLLDGTTPSPVFSIDPSSPDFKAADPDGVYRFDIEGNLGFIDPDFDTGGSQGDRFIRAFALNTAVAGESISDLVGVVALDEEVFAGGGLLLQIVANLDGVQEAGVAKGCIFVPQGSVVALRGADVPPPPDSPSVIRLAIDIPDSLVEYAEMLQACCCENETETGCAPPIISNVNPTGFFPFELPVEMTVTGSNFLPTTTVTLQPQFPAPTGTFDNLVITPTEITFDITFIGVGPYNVVLSNGEGCSVAAPFFVQPPV